MMGMCREKLAHILNKTSRLRKEIHDLSNDINNSVHELRRIQHYNMRFKSRRINLETYDHGDANELVYKRKYSNDRPIGNYSHQ